MSLRDAAQNTVLWIGATKKGHVLNRAACVNGVPDVKCSACGKLFYNICEDAKEDVKASREIQTCTKKV